MGSGEEFLPAEGSWQNFSQGKITIRGGWQNFLSGKSFLALTLPKESISLPLGNLILFMGMGKLKLFPKWTLVYKKLPFGKEISFKPCTLSLFYPNTYSLLVLLTLMPILSFLKPF